MRESEVEKVCVRIRERKIHVCERENVCACVRERNSEKVYVYVIVLLTFIL